MRLGAELPFATAAEVLARCTGTHVSAATIRRLTQASGASLQEQARVVRRAVQTGNAAPVARPSAPLQLSVDGSMVPLLGGEWREVRVAAVGRLQSGATGPQLTDLSYTATLGTAEMFSQEALGELHRRGVDQAPTVVAVSDGAPWIQGFVDLHCPQAVRVLDFAHAAGYLAQAAQASFGPGTAATSDWFATQRHALRHGAPEQVLAALTALPASAERETALRYLGERRSMIRYRDLHDAGWPIGSGCVESAHKTVLQARLKRSGMHWSQAGAAAMIALRLTLANDRWDSAWTQVGAHQRAQQRVRSTARRRARLPASPALVPAIPAPAPPPGATPSAAALDARRPSSTPSANHPWRQAVVRFRPRPLTQT